MTEFEFIVSTLIPQSQASTQAQTPASGPNPTRAALAAFDADIPHRSGRWSDTTDTWIENALLLIEHGELPAAKHLLRQSLSQNPYSPTAIRWLGECLRGEGDYAGAVGCFEQLVRLDPSDLSFCWLADVQYLQNRDSEALQNYRRALSLVEHESGLLFEIYKNIGNIFVRAGDFEAAEENYNRAYTLNPTSDALMVNYGTLEIQRDNFADATLRFRAAIACCASNDRAWVGLAVVHRHHGDFKLAWANLERALDLNPENQTALRLMIEWSLNDHKQERAIERLRTYVDRGGQDMTLAQWLSQLLLICGQLAEAEFEIERVLAWEPTQPEAEILAREIRAQQRRRVGRD